MVSVAWHPIFFLGKIMFFVYPSIAVLDAYLFLTSVLMFSGLGRYFSRPKVVGVFKVVSEYCSCSKTLVPEEKIFAGL